MSDFLTALGLVLVIEGTFYAAAPGAMKRMMMQAIDLPESTMRVAGLVALTLGVGAVWLIRS